QASHDPRKHKEHRSEAKGEAESIDLYRDRSDLENTEVQHLHERDKTQQQRKNHHPVDEQVAKDDGHQRPGIESKAELGCEEAGVVAEMTNGARCRVSGGVGSGTGERVEDF